MFSIDINCDMGEGMDTDALLMPYISSANIACGYHAGNEDIMKRTCELALRSGVSIGAHPGFDDKENFGRIEKQLSAEQLYDLVSIQVYRLRSITETFGAMLQHVKPHGALYNMSAKDPAMASVIAKAVRDADEQLALFGLSGSHSITEAQKLDQPTMNEVFADRTYQDDGSLTPRSQPNALIQTGEVSIQQVLQMVQTQMVTSVNNKTIPIIAETICLHGDGPHAVAFARLISQTLKNEAIGIGKK